MSLLAAVSGSDLTAIRSDNAYRALQFVCVVPNDVVVSFQPGIAPSTSVFAEIAAGTIASGSMANIEEGQLVIFSTSSDYQATETFRTRVRKVLGTSILYVGENSQTLTTSDYVTVIDTYQIEEKLRRDETRLDWEITFRKLLPIETALPSAVVITNGGTQYTSVAAPIVMDADASSISTHAWTSSNSNDSFSNAALAQPVITLEAGTFRWLRYTFTDNLGNSNYRVIPCWTVPKNYSSAVATGFGTEDGTLATITYDASLGWTCSLAAFSGIATLLNKTYTVIASDEWYNDSRQSIRTNIDFVGYLQSESVDTRGDERYGRISETAFTVEGFGHQMARQNVVSVLVKQNASPSAWDDIKDPTPARMLTYRITEYSTLSNLCSLTIPSDDTSFVGDDLTLANDKLLDDVRFIAEVINAELQFDIDGKLDLCRNLNFLDATARNAASVIATLSPDDFDSDYRTDYEYGFTTSAVNMTGGVYASSADIYTLYEAIAPAVARYGEGDPVEISNQVLTTDSTAANALAEVAERCANHLAANNPTWTLRVTLKDEWHFLVPDVGAWFKFDIVAADTARGKVFDTNDRWQLVQLSVTTNSLTGRRQVSAVFRHETQSTGASVRANPIINDIDADIDYFPAVLPPFTNADLGLTDDLWYDDQDVQPPSNPNPVPANCSLQGLRPKSGGVVFSPSIATANVSVAVRGSGGIGDGNWCQNFDFTASDGGFVGFKNSTQPIGDRYDAGVGWVSNNWDSGATPERVLSVRLPIPAGDWVITDMAITTSVNGGPTSVNNLYGVADGTLGANFVGFHNPATGTQTRSGLSASIQQYVYLYSSHNFGAFTVSSIQLSGTGTNPFGASNCGTPTDGLIGDAFYFTPDGVNWQAYGVGDGLYIEGVQQNIPPFNPEHEYFLPEVVVTGLATIEYEFRSATFIRTNFENWNLQMITCEI